MSRSWGMAADVCAGMLRMPGGSVGNTTGIPRSRIVFLGSSMGAGSCVHASTLVRLGRGTGVNRHAHCGRCQN